MYKQSQRRAFTVTASFTEKSADFSADAKKKSDGKFNKRKINR